MSAVSADECSAGIGCEAHGNEMTRYGVHVRNPADGDYYQIATKPAERKVWWRIPTRGPRQEIDLRKYFTNA